MRTAATIIWMAAFAVATTEPAICQQPAQAKPPAQVVVTGVIKARTGNGTLVLSVTEKSGQAQDVSIVFSKETVITMDDKSATAADLRVGRAVSVTCATSNATLGANAGSAGETPQRTARSISIIFGNNATPASDEPAQQPASAKIPGDFIGSWIFTEKPKTEKLQITADHIRWTRTEDDFHEVNDSESNTLSGNGAVSFDAKVLLTKDNSATARVTLKIQDGRLIMKVGPSFIDLGDVKLSNQGEEVVYIRDQTPGTTDDKSAPGPLKDVSGPEGPPRSGFPAFCSQSAGFVCGSGGGERGYEDGIAEFIAKRDRSVYGVCGRQ
ncbi:MAG TPA: hypothetical protein VMV72_11475 [Verrucomicrobiae bacterium]|nr:hypothetical protein [Verrucomicrobiae bacterium]